MDKITYDTFGLIESATHHFTIDASQLGLEPGVWPMLLETTIGNKQPFVARRYEGGATVYWQSMGCVTLTIFND